MGYDMEELVSIVAKLAEEYTSKESTSITYEKAQQFMDAVLYCINEAEKMERYSLIQENGVSAHEMYKIGVSCVKEKIKETMEIFNNVITHFSSYGNECLNDTVVKGLPEFFKWYDYKYEPQNTILTLDYPVLVDITEHTGIDRIYDFVICIRLEQRFLNRFSTEYVVEVLSKYDREYKLMVDNICEIVLTSVLGHILLEKEISAKGFDTEDYQNIQEVIQQTSLDELRLKLKNAVEKMVQKYYDNDDKLKEYLYHGVRNISVRIKNAADNGNLHANLI